ncbi:MAG: putative toxin-antitoxin system toxin component, PIN family [Acidobacteria bacterium]|nr:putative toxin-antitoxin system toxin component, PIN family [Acidobacteriota bacterium]
MCQIIIDTNVLLSALRSDSGASFQLLRLIPDERFEINLSVPLVLEYEDVLKRLEMDVHLDHATIDDILDFLCQTGRLRIIRFLWRPTLRDPDDDFLLELAVECSCDYIVTFNTKDFMNSSSFGISAVKPLEFLRIIGELK